MKPFTALRNATLSSIVAACCSASGVSSASAQASAPESDQEITELVETLGGGMHPRDAAIRLKAAGKRAAPAIVKVLSDAAKCDAVVEKFNFKSAPFAALTLALSREQGPEVVAPLAKYLASDKPEVRSAAARGLGQIALQECVEPMLKALADPDEKVVGQALIGIRMALRAFEYSPEFLVGIFPGVEKLVRSEKLGRRSDAWRALAAADPVRAAAVFESPELFKLDHPNLKDLLFAVGDYGLKLDRAKLLKLMDEARAKLGEDTDYAFIYGGLLHAYGHNPDANAEAVLRRELKTESPSDIVAINAAEGLAAMAGVVNVRQRVNAKHDKLGLAGLRPAERHYYLPQNCYQGLRLFFDSGYGDQWKETLAAFDAIGAVEQAKILRETIALFKPKEPDAVGYKRRDQMDDFSPEQKKKFDELSKAFRECKPDLMVHTALYTAANPKEFRD